MTAKLYLDLISPYAYFYWQQRHRLHPSIRPTPVLVLFGGILKAWEHKGPAELPTKRLHTYAHCVWTARQHNIAFTMPPRHPFNPLKALRLLIATGSEEAQIDKAFDWIWAQGHDPELEFAAFANHLNIDNPEQLISQALIKAALIEQTEGAVSRGVWGVPTLDFNGQLLWGFDTIDWANELAHNKGLMQESDFARASQCAVGIKRE